MSNNIEEDIKSVMNSIVSHAMDGNKEAVAGLLKEESVISAVKAAKEFDIDQYDFNFNYHIENMVSGVVATITDNNKCRFLLEHCSFVERHYEKLITRKESFVCCADKSRTIMNSLLKFFMTGEEIKFNYSGKYTYHLPDKIFKTHADILDMFDALYHLYYGRGDKYIKMISTIDLEHKDDDYFKSLKTKGE